MTRSPPLKGCNQKHPCLPLTDEGVQNRRSGYIR